MDRWGRLFEWQMVLVGGTGLVMTLLFVAPGEHAVALGPLRFDPFYALVALFAGVCLSAALALRGTASTD